MEWIDNPPESLDEQIFILERYGYQLKDKTPAGSTLRQILSQCRKHYDEALSDLKWRCPPAFFKPSYEQALLLNAWVWGINFPICFSANRIGKTVAMIFNGILWMYPNDPNWQPFQSYIDHRSRMVYVLQRCNLSKVLKIQQYLTYHPELMGNPYKQPYDQANIVKFTMLKNALPECFTSCYPYPPIQHGATIWLGAPDNDFHKNTTMPLWRTYLPKPILKDNETDRYFLISTASSTNPKTTIHKLVCKSYESEETKWSATAVDGIILTEGFEAHLLDEIKQRLKNEAFASWDYTPADARNTGKKVSLAYKIYKKQEELPLRSFVFLKFSVRDAPDHIIPTEKKDDLIRMWESKDQGKARLDGDFYTSSGLVLDQLDREFHCLNWSLDELFQRYPDGRFYRGIDPGLDHPTSCCWGYLSYNNIWFIYRFYSERGKTISERCQDIITLSNNQRQKSISKNNYLFWREVHHQPNSEAFVATIVDYHVFKEDEVTGLNYANQYNQEGLVLTESTHMRPEERAQKVNSLLDRSAFPYLASPKTNLPPGAKIFFLTSQPGVATALDKFDQLFWDRYQSGSLKGEPKDKVPIHGEDELDALSYLVCGPYAWSQHKPIRRTPNDSEPELILSSSPPKRAHTQQSLLVGTPGHFGG